MAMANNFNLRSGTHRLVALLVLALAFSSAFIMLGSIAALQHSCPSDFDLGTNNNIFALAGTGSSTDVLGVLSSRSATSAHVLTPDTRCSKYYRYQWLLVAFQLFVCSLVFLAVITNLAHVSRVALCSILAIAALLAFENCNTFYYFYHEVATTGAANKRAKTFFAGTIIASVANVLLIWVLGTHNEAMGYNGFLGAETARPVVVGEQQQGALRTYQTTTTVTDAGVHKV